MAVLIDPNDASQWSFVLELLSQGKPVVLPTETVYGLAAVATHEPALAQIFRIKERPHFDPLIVHVLDVSHARHLVTKITPLHEQLARAFWPGPLSLLFEKTEQVPDLCTAGSQWVALRSPEHAVFRRALKDLQKPLAAPSANRFGRISPTMASHALTELGPMGVEAIVHGGPCRLGLESTVVKVLSQTQIHILRPGSLSREHIAEVLGPKVEIVVSEQGHGMQMESPGLSQSHYAPRKKKLHFVENPLEQWFEWQLSDVRSSALLCAYADSHCETYRQLPWAVVEVLSQSCIDTEAAPKVFQTLRSLDENNKVQKIVVLKCSDSGLGQAMNDRFRRASQK